MGDAYQIKNQEALFLLTFQVVGWADVFSRQLYKDIILEMIFYYHAKYNKRSGEEQFWTHENHAVELSTNSLIETQLNYIHENPVKAGIVAEAEDYLYSSAGNYAEMEALIEIDLI